jgi:hypothetical protein
MNRLNQHTQFKTRHHPSANIQQSTGKNQDNRVSRYQKKSTVDEETSYRTHAGHWKHSDQPDEEKNAGTNRKQIKIE